MQWDLGLQGLAVLAALSLGCGLVAGLLVGRGVGHRLRATAITTLACFGVGLLISEGLFGWATEEELQPNIDGLSWDEAFLSSVLTTVLVVLVMRYLKRRARDQTTTGETTRDDLQTAIGNFRSAVLRRVSPGTEVDHYDEIRDLADAIASKADARGWSGWSHEMQELLRGPAQELPPGFTYYGQGDAPRETTPEWAVYALLRQEGNDNREFITLIAQQYPQLHWWLRRYREDQSQPTSLTEYAARDLSHYAQ